MQYNKLIYSFIFLIIFIPNLNGFSLNIFGGENEMDDAIPFALMSTNRPDVPDLGAEGEMLFSELLGDIYQIQNNGISKISDKHRVKTKIKDIEYAYNGKGIILIPNFNNEEQIEAIDDFYNMKNIKGKRLLKEIAEKNRVAAITFGNISNMQVNRIVNNGSGDLIIYIKIYLYQSGAEQLKRLKFHIEDINTNPYYDPDELIVKVENKVLEAYESVIATIQQSGNVVTGMGNIKEYDDKDEQKEEEEEESTQNAQTTSSTQTASNTQEVGASDDW